MPANAFQGFYPVLSSAYSLLADYNSAIFIRSLLQLTTPSNYKLI